MQLKSINGNKIKVQNLAIETVQWPKKTPIDDQAATKALANNVLAFQTTRITPDGYQAQQSQPFHYFNLGLHVGDCPTQVEKNRQFLQTLLPEKTKIQWLEQVHGNTAVEVSQISSQNIVADAIYTSNKNICLAIMTADCLPILLVSKSGDEIGAIHGGWRPLASNIIQNTIEKMKTSSENIYAWLGPCISQIAFEVGREVKKKFISQDESFQTAFLANGNGKYLADLHKIATIQLNNLGVTQISNLSECTYSNTNKYYSFRKHAVTGRMATLICLM